MMQMILVAAFLVAIATIACGPSATTSESDSGTSPQQPEESGPALLLSEESAISILRAFLQDCVLGWDNLPDRKNLPSEENKSRLIDIATGTTGDIVWSASYHGVTEVPNSYTRAGTAIEAETWVVIGPGFERARSQLAAPGRWKVYAGHRKAYYLDAPARLALTQYNLEGSSGRGVRRHYSCP
jgi:hypothetical protein